MNWKQTVRRTALAVAVALALVYFADFAVLRIRMRHPAPDTPFESMTRVRVLAIPTKSGKYDYQLDALNPSETVTCVHALFPHGGNSPCWYVKPRINQPIKVS